VYIVTILAAVLSHASETVPVAKIPSSFPPARESFAIQDRIVGAYFFHWYTTTSGQQSGPWPPMEGRRRWTGEPSSWKPLIMQLMAANIDIIWVHLMNEYEPQRENFFRALCSMRAEGHDVPKVAPFLDPELTWRDESRIDLIVDANKDRFCAPYIRFFRQYFKANPDTHADLYLARIDGRVVLGTWHMHLRFHNMEHLSRHDVESRLRAALASEHRLFDKGYYLVTQAEQRYEGKSTVLAWADERVHQFDDTTHYIQSTLHGAITATQIKPGYWDQNYRAPGAFLPRDGGRPYRDAWSAVDRRTVQRVYIESFNEYDEGTGIYAASVIQGPARRGASEQHSDTWSANADPWEYLKITARAARGFNVSPDYDASILAHGLPNRLSPGQRVTASVLVRNDGDVAWDAAQGVVLADQEGAFGLAPGAIPVAVESANDHWLTSRVFRGSPITVHVTLTAPQIPGLYKSNWRMHSEDAGWFGKALDHRIQVGDPKGRGVEAVKFGWLAAIAAIFAAIWWLRRYLDKRATMILLAFLSSSNSASAQVTNDLFDVSRGTKVVSASDTLPEFGPEGILGGSTPGESNSGATIFKDDGRSFVEFQTLAPVEIEGVELFVRGDNLEPGAPRSVDTFSLHADCDGDGSFETVLVDHAPPLNNGTCNRYLFAPVTAAMFRAEFTPGSTTRGDRSGPRVVELDAVAAADGMVWLWGAATASSVLLALALGWAYWRRRPTAG